MLCAVQYNTLIRIADEIKHSGGQQVHCALFFWSFSSRKLCHSLRHLRPLRSASFTEDLCPKICRTNHQNGLTGRYFAMDDGRM